MYRPSMLMFVIASLVCSQQVGAQRGVGVGWSLSAVGDGWYLQTISGAGERLIVMCAPVEHGRWTYGLEVKSNQTRPYAHNAKAEMVINSLPQVWRYQLAVNGPGAASTDLNRSSFIKLLQQLSGLTLGDSVSVPRLKLRVAPRVSDQEVTFQEFKKLCRLDPR
jgi:hypothetical protein